MRDRPSRDEERSINGRGSARSVRLEASGHIQFELLGEEHLDEFVAFLFRVYRDAYTHIGIHMQQEQQQRFAEDTHRYFADTKIYLARIEDRRIIASYGNIIKRTDQLLPIEKLFSLSITGYAADIGIAPKLIHQTWRVGGDGGLFRELGFSTTDKKSLFHSLHALNISDFGNDDDNLVCGYSYNPAWKLDKQLGFPWRIIGATQLSRLGVPSFPMAFTIREWKARNREKLWQQHQASSADSDIP